jgi:hypothetical protein
MIRLMTFAAVAALIAAPATAQEVRVKLAGKSAEQARVEVTQAVRSVCIRATSTDSLRHIAIDRCVREIGEKAQADLATKLAAKAAPRAVATR